MRIGVVAVQGDFEAHQSALKSLGVKTCSVKKPTDLNGVDAVILPGGESTVQVRLLQENGLFAKLDECFRLGTPFFATCAGTILSATKLSESQQPTFGWLPAVVERNSYGDQRHSFETSVEFGKQTIRLTFIRAPRIVELLDQNVQTLLEVDGDPVLVQYRNLLAATFHPEISGDRSVYRYWLNHCEAFSKKLAS